jgi:hypothetical protein
VRLPPLAGAANTGTQGILYLLYRSRRSRSTGIGSARPEDGGTGGSSCSCHRFGLCRLRRNTRRSLFLCDLQRPAQWRPFDLNNVPATADLHRHDSLDDCRQHVTLRRDVSVAHCRAPSLIHCQNCLQRGSVTIGSTTSSQFNSPVALSRSELNMSRKSSWPALSLSPRSSSRQQARTRSRRAVRCGDGPHF